MDIPNAGHKWTEEHCNYLIENANESDDILAEYFGRTESAVRGKRVGLAYIMKTDDESIDIICEQMHIIRETFDIYAGKKIKMIKKKEDNPNINNYHTVPSMEMILKMQKDINTLKKQVCILVDIIHARN